MGLVKILSIDGGGIRGIIPAVILAEIERITQKPIAEMFDLIAGTSTGGILTLGLTKPDSSGKPQYSAKDLIELYENEGKKIFSPSLDWAIFEQPIFRPKYSTDGIEGVLQKYFQNTHLSQALKEVLITSYDIELRLPYFFKRSKAIAHPERHDFLMQQVARATSAAPTYFEPLKLETLDGETYYPLIDGGVFANNPALCAYIEAKTMFPDATDFLVVSIGTGELSARLPYEDVKNWGIAQWAQPVLNVVFDGVGDTVDYQLKQLLPPSRDGKQRYYRFQTEKLERGNQIDETSPENIHSLKLLAQEIISKNENSLKQLFDTPRTEVTRILGSTPHH